LVVGSRSRHADERCTETMHTSSCSTMPLPLPCLSGDCAPLLRHAGTSHVSSVQLCRQIVRGEPLVAWPVGRPVVVLILPLEQTRVNNIASVNITGISTTNTAAAAAASTWRRTVAYCVLTALQSITVNRRRSTQSCRCRGQSNMWPLLRLTLFRYRHYYRPKSKFGV